MPVGGAPAARLRFGGGGNLRPHAEHVVASATFSAVQNGQNLT
jgi:hypothetical protein